MQVIAWPTITLRTLSAEQVWSRVVCGLTPDACWLWLPKYHRERALSARRAPQVHIKGVRYPAARLVYLLATETTLPCDRYLSRRDDRRCSYLCVNPAHRLLSTNANASGKGHPHKKGPSVTLRGNRVVCKRGHTHTQENTTVLFYTRPDGSTGRRFNCKACRKYTAHLRYLREKREALYGRDNNANPIA